MKAVKAGLLLLILSLAFSIGTIAAAIKIECEAKVPFFVYLLGAPTLSELEIPTHLIILYNVMFALFWVTLITGIVLLVIGSLKKLEKKSER